MLCDSTNVLSPGTSGSEAEVRDSLTELIADQPNRVVLTSFASNVARMETAMLAAQAAGRELFVVGRSMRRMIDAAREVGYLQGRAADPRRARGRAAAAQHACSISAPAARARRAAPWSGSPPASTRGCGSSPATR